MNAPVRLEAPAKPTREQALRFITLSVECAREAHRQMPSGRILGDHEGLPPRNFAREALIDQLRLEAMEREGLPMSLLPARASLHSFADLDEDARHPMQAVNLMVGVS